MGVATPTGELLSSNGTGQSSSSTMIAEEADEGTATLDGSEDGATQAISPLLDDSQVNKDGEMDDVSPYVTIEQELSRVPDGNWGWYVVLGSGLVHVLMGGFERGNGILYLQLRDKFQESATNTSWVFSLFSTLRLLLGPLSSALCNRFGCRTIGMLGGFIAALGMFLSSLVPSLPYLYFTYGILGGVGRSFIYTPSLIIVGAYFNKRRGLAVGLATSGVGVGTFFIPPLIEILFQEYGYQGALMILSALVSNFILAAALFMPIEKFQMIRRKEMIAEQKKKNPDMFTTVQPQPEIPDTVDNNPLLKLKHSPDVSSSMEVIANMKVESRRSSLFVRQLRRVKSALKSDETEGKKKQPFLEISLLKDFTFLMLCVGIMFFTVAFYSAFVFLPALIKSRGISEIDSAYVVSIIGVVDTVSRITTSILLDLKAVKPYRLLIYNLSMFLNGVVCVIIPIMYSYTEFMVISAAFGILSGMYISQKSVVIVDILGPEKISSSFGLLLLFQGFGSAIGPTAGGIIKDTLGSYEGSFYLGAGGIFLGAVCVVIGNVYKFVSDRKRRKLEISENHI